MIQSKRKNSIPEYFMNHINVSVTTYEWKISTSWILMNPTEELAGSGEKLALEDRRIPI